MSNSTKYFDHHCSTSKEDIVENITEYHNKAFCVVFYDEVCKDRNEAINIIETFKKSKNQFHSVKYWQNNQLYWLTKIF